MLLLLASWTLSSSSALPVSGATCGRMYEGIGGLINSDAPWLKGLVRLCKSKYLSCRVLVRATIDKTQSLTLSTFVQPPCTFGQPTISANAGAGARVA